MYLYWETPAHLKRLPKNKRRPGKLIRLHADHDGTIPRRRLNKKGISNALLAQLELAGMVAPLRNRTEKLGNPATVLYRVSELRSCWRAFRLRGLRVEFNWF